MVTDLEALTGCVATLKLAVLAPTGTVTDAGTVTELSSLDNDTVAPPAGAAPLRTTDPVDEVPPATLAGWKVTRVGAMTVFDEGAKATGPAGPGTEKALARVLVAVENTETVPLVLLI